MGFFNNFPYTNFHELNLDWAMDVVKKISIEFPELSSNIEKFEKDIIAKVEQLETDVANFDKKYLENYVKSYIATMIFPEISDSGYIIYNIPDTWESVDFGTTGVDVVLEMQPEYGHLVLSY